MAVNTFNVTQLRFLSHIQQPPNNNLSAEVSQFKIFPRAQIQQLRKKPQRGVQNIYAKTGDSSMNMYVM
jgi:hypothetical protein